ncbi:carbohydrate ABC transporter permease [uncultured Treponema sp.]|uniref:carbohydrate ABC transporter permease n=1 Tax=Treponema sp. TaxID=166 RepID=UPI002582A135|nr:carbohydrate ABC transporter permease [uncultured Treponema sp.]
MLIVNSTRVHSQLINGFSFIPGKYFFFNLKNLLSNDNIPVVGALLNSVMVSVGNAVFATYFSAMTAYGIHMYRFKGRKFAFSFIMAVMMVPAQVTTLGFLRLIGAINLDDNLLALIIPAIASPVVFFYMLQYLQAFLSKSLVEASRIDGCGEFRTFNTIVIPIIKPAIAVQGIFAFVSSWNNYFLPALVINSKSRKTIPILIAQLRAADYMKFDLAQVYMLIFIAIIPLLIVYLLLSRQIIGGVTLGGVKE